jgi:hypothetical protein
MSPCFAGGEEVRLSGEAATGLQGNLVGRRRGLVISRMERGWLPDE